MPTFFSSIKICYAIYIQHNDMIDIENSITQLLLKDRGLFVTPVVSYAFANFTCKNNFARPDKNDKYMKVLEWNPKTNFAKSLARRVNLGQYLQFSHVLHEAPC